MNIHLAVNGNAHQIIAEDNLTLLDLLRDDLHLTGARATHPVLDPLIGNAQQLPFPPSYFDGVLMECTLSLMSEPGQAFSEAYRVLRNGGKMILSDFYHRRGI